MSHNPPEDPERAASTPPPWCAPPERLVGRDGVLFDALAALTEGPITLVGQPGVGTTVTAAALMQRLLRDSRAERAVYLRLDEHSTRTDGVLALGRGVHAMLPGDEPSVRATLRQGPATAVMLDDADLAVDVATHLVGIGPDCQWVLTARVPVLGAPVIVSSLPDEAMRELLGPDRDVEALGGRPVLADWELPDPERPWWEVAGLPDGTRLLAALPMGVREPPRPIPRRFRLPDAERTVLRRCVRDALGGRRLDAEPVAELLEPRRDELIALACDVSESTDPEDLRLYRTAARVVADDDLAALVGCAAARLALRSFQASEALQILRDLGDRRPGRDVHGLVRWLEADALLAQGAGDLAHAAHLDAASQLRGTGSVTLLVTLSRRCADRWASRGDAARARKWLAEARAELAMHPDPAALADTLRVAGNLAAHAGELVGAAALYDEALATLSQSGTHPRERAAILIGRGALAMTLGRYPEAEAALTEAEACGDDRLTGAAVAYRRAELAVRRGRLDDARDVLAEAETCFRARGTLRGLVLCARMRGDLAALQGDRLAAAAAYRVAMAFCVRARDLSGVHRVLRRALVIEREGLPGPHITDLQQHLDLAEVLLRVR